MSRTRGRSSRWRIGRSGLLLLLLAAVRPASAQAPDAPPVVRAIHRGFEGFFLFTTNGSGRYRIYQKIEDDTGIPDDADITCLQRDCFLKLAEVPAARLGKDAPLGALRERFRAVQAAYVVVRSGPAPDRRSAVQAWRDAIRELESCLDARIGECRQN